MCFPHQQSGLFSLAMPTILCTATRREWNLYTGREGFFSFHCLRLRGKQTKERSATWLRELWKFCLMYNFRVKRSWNVCNWSHLAPSHCHLAMTGAVEVHSLGCKTSRFQKSLSSNLKMWWTCMPTSVPVAMLNSPPHLNEWHTCRSTIFP